MMIWNRKEVFVGNSLQGFTEVRQKLSLSNIKYDYKIVDNTSPSFFGPSTRARTGTYGVNMDYTKTYYIYVHKNNYDMAQASLRN
jgi:hypothetical protein